MNHKSFVIHLLCMNVLENKSIWHILLWLENIFQLKFQGQSECLMVHTFFYANHVVTSNKNLACCPLSPLIARHLFSGTWVHNPILPMETGKLSLFPSPHHCLICLLIPGGVCEEVRRPLFTPVCSSVLILWIVQFPPGSTQCLSVKNELSALNKATFTGKINAHYTVCIHRANGADKI